MQTKFYNDTDRKSAGVYRILNTNNRKVYIGATEKEFAARWRDHKNLLKNGKHANIHLQRSFDRHGEEAFVFQGLKEVNENVWEKERKCLDVHKTADFECYNILEEEIWKPPRQEWTEERRERRSKRFKKMWETDREKFVEAAYEKKTKFSGKKLRGDDGEIYTIEKNLAEFCRNYDLDFHSSLTEMLSGDRKDVKYIRGWSQAERLFDRQTYRKMYSYWEMKNLETGEVVGASNFRDLANKIDGHPGSLTEPFKQDYAYKGKWKPTDYVHPNKTYQQIKKEHEQLTSN